MGSGQTVAPGTSACISGVDVTTSFAAVGIMELVEIVKREETA